MLGALFCFNNHSHSISTVPTLSLHQFLPCQCERDANGVPYPIPAGDEPVLTYTPGNLDLEFGQNFAGEWDISLDFDYSGPSGTSFQAVIYPQTDRGECNFDTHIAQTPDAHISAKTAAGFGPTLDEAFTMWFDADDTKLYIDTPFEFFDVSNPFWSLSDDGTVTDGKGELAFCVEIQAFYCDQKVDIVDVAVTIDFNPVSTCDCEPPRCLVPPDRDCIIANLKRDRPVDDTGDVEPFPITCDICEGTDTGPFFPGEPIKICICLLEEEVLDDACIDEILGLYMSVYRLPDYFFLGTFELAPDPSFLLFSSGITCDENDCTFACSNSLNAPSCCGTNLCCLFPLMLLLPRLLG